MAVHATLMELGWLEYSPFLLEVITDLVLFQSL